MFGEVEDKYEQKRKKRLIPRRSSAILQMTAFFTHKNMEETEYEIQTNQKR